MSGASTLALAVLEWALYAFCVLAALTTVSTIAQAAGGDVDAYRLGTITGGFVWGGLALLAARAIRRRRVRAAATGGAA